MRVRNRPTRREYNPSRTTMKTRLAHSTRSNSVDTPIRLGLDSPSDMAITLERKRHGNEDASAYEAAESRPGMPIRLRLQPQLYFKVENARYRTGAFFAWRDVYWNLQCATTREAILIKDALQAFFEAVKRLGPSRVQQVLDTAGGVVVESAPAEVAVSSSGQSTIR